MFISLGAAGPGGSLGEGGVILNERLVLPALDPGSGSGSSEAVIPPEFLLACSRTAGRDGRGSLQTVGRHWICLWPCSPRSLEGGNP